MLDSNRFRVANSVADSTTGYSMDDQPSEMTVPETLSVLARYLPLVLLSALAIGTLTFIISSLQTRQFDANGRLELSTQVDFYDIDGKRFAAETYLRSDETIEQINSYAEGIGTEILNIRVDLPADSKGIDVNVSATTADGASMVTDELLRLAAANDDAERSEQIDDARTGIQLLMDRLATEMEELDAEKAIVTEQLVTATDVERQVLQGKFEQLSRDRNARQDQRNQKQRELDELELDLDYRRANLEVAWKSLTPTDASRPKPARNGFLGFLLGAMIGSAMVMVFFRDQARIRDADRLGAHLGTPLLAETSLGTPSNDLMPAAVAMARRANGQRVGALSLAECAADASAAKSLNMLLAQRMDDATRDHWLQVPPGTPGAPWVVACGDLESPSSASYLDMVDTVVLLVESGNISVKKAHAAASRLQALGIASLGIVVVS